MFAANVPQTMKRVYQDIKSGDDPWVALGDFSHDWFGNYSELDQRIALIVEPIELSQETEPVELRQWAAFCAASVEFLCLQADMPVPLWANDPVYILGVEEPFYTSPLAYKPRVRERLEQEAPDAFKKRRVFCSARVFANKYERLTA